MDAIEERKCQYRVVCSKSSASCTPPHPISFEKEPECYVPAAEGKKSEVYSFKKSYQQKRWEELQQITWEDVFSFRERLIYILLLLTSIAFIIVFAAFLKTIATLMKS